jgi:hypothetical protein
MGVDILSQLQSGKFAEVMGTKRRMGAYICQAATF